MQSINQSIKQTSKPNKRASKPNKGTCIHSLHLDERHGHHVADDEDDDGGLNDSTVSLSACHHQQAADIVITAVRRWSVPCTGMETVSQPVVSSVVAGMCTEGCTGTSCTTASNRQFSLLSFCVFTQVASPPAQWGAASCSPPSPSTTTAAVFRHLILCQRGITPRGHSRHCTLPVSSSSLRWMLLARGPPHSAARRWPSCFWFACMCWPTWRRSGSWTTTTILQYRMLRGLMGVSVCKDMFAPDAHELMRIMRASTAQIEEEDPQPSYIHTRVPGSRESPNTSATKNCISVFVKIARNPAHGLSEVLTHLLDWLPITEDDDEAKYIFTHLVELLQARQHPRVTAPESPVKIVRAFVCAGDWHPRGRRRRAPLPGHVHSLMNMQDSPAHGVLGQLMQDPEAHARVQRAVEALSSSA
ncbi:hypothetical protein PTSG_12861 [Salpingoeca rosetta]|uniref:Uncharacterized protein n=1 Tax=Salpingoeca rosetta (strain ATCC 50818 / BSB-021) TaxID=946362 RepID=F2UN96_SALR5|nr:uncharacterized protein PTSG_12861 [Salpingoeca rosetta]EGD78594.1 hypothetical protein PTSG_12861 [Salpingoeca rosetta]|eukprot:XP_004989543.1 hypothetical protein PTSG_12861 [Salpingoeca rosetta]